MTRNPVAEGVEWPRIMTHSLPAAGNASPTAPSEDGHRAIVCKGHRYQYAYRMRRCLSRTDVGDASGIPVWPLCLRLTHAPQCHDTVHLVAEGDVTRCCVFVQSEPGN